MTIDSREPIQRFEVSLRKHPTIFDKFAFQNDNPWHLVLGEVGLDQLPEKIKSAKRQIENDPFYKGWKVRVTSELI
jgi:hypothetical protein